MQSHHADNPDDLFYASPVADSCRRSVYDGAVSSWGEPWIYRIDGPTLRDWFFAHQQRNLPAVTVTSKIIRVESGEVVYDNVVTARANETEVSAWLLSDTVDYHRWSREAIDLGVMQTVLDLIAHLNDRVDITGR